MDNLPESGAPERTQPQLGSQAQECVVEGRYTSCREYTRLCVVRVGKNGLLLVVLGCRTFRVVICHLGGSTESVHRGEGTTGCVEYP